MSAEALEALAAAEDFPADVSADDLFGPDMDAAEIDSTLAPLGLDSASRPIQGHSVQHLHVTPRRHTYSSVPPSPRVPMTAAEEIRALRAHNEALQRQLALKDQGLERLRKSCLLYTSPSPRDS